MSDIPVQGALPPLQKVADDLYRALMEGRQRPRDIDFDAYGWEGRARQACNEYEAMAGLHASASPPARRITTAALLPTTPAWGEPWTQTEPAQ